MIHSLGISCACVDQWRPASAVVGQCPKANFSNPLRPRKVPVRPRHRSDSTRYGDCGVLRRAEARVGAAAGNVEIETDVVVVGSGIGGLSAAALLAHAGFRVLVLESHYHPGGAAHAFDVQGYKFDAGPSFHAGLSVDRSSNPLKQVLDLVGEKVEYVTYDRWMTYTPEGTFPTVCERDAFVEVLRRQGGEQAYRDWLRLEAAMKPLHQGAASFPASAIRADVWMGLIGFLFGPSLWKTGLLAGTLTGPFSRLVDQHVTDPWLRKWLDLECYVLSGMLAADTICAEMAFMFQERHSPTTAIDYPLGGGGAIVDALVRGITKHGGKIMLSTHVDRVLGEEGGFKATGVVATERRGTSKERTVTVRAAKAVVSNLSVWDNAKLLRTSCLLPPRTVEAKLKTPACGSFMHLHLGIDATGLPDDLECHHLIVNDWSDLEAEQNVIIVSIPTVFDKTLAPPGRAVVHSYVAASEPWDVWKDVQPGTPEYDRLKEERSQCLWRALERVIPDIRQRAEGGVVMVGTPHTHQRFLNRHQGTYGPAISAGKGQSFPGPQGTFPIERFYCVGDSTAPGIGVPAASASGMIAANTIMGIGKHLEWLRAENIL